MGSFVSVDRFPRGGDAAEGYAPEGKTYNPNVRQGWHGYDGDEPGFDGERGFRGACVPRNEPGKWWLGIRIVKVGSIVNEARAIKTFEAICNAPRLRPTR